MNVLLEAKIVEVENGVLLTLERVPQPTAGDPMAQRNGFKIGPTYYPSFETAVADIHSVIAVREAKKALKV